MTPISWEWPPSLASFAMIWRKPSVWLSGLLKLSRGILGRSTPFLKAHWDFALALAGRRETLEKLLAAVSERAAQTDDEACRVWAPCGAPIVEACAFFGAGDSASEVKFLEPAMPGMMQIGGSDAHYDLFRQAYFCALARTGRKAEAAAYLNRVLGNKKRSALDEYFNELIV